MPLLDGPSLGGNARHVLRQYAEESALARGRAANAAGTEEFGGGCLRGRYNNLREVIQNNPSIVVVPSIINAGSLFVQRPICRTNYLPNNSMAGATGSVLPTTWASGTIPAGFTFSVGASGQATANDGTLVNYVDVSVSGTATASGTFNLFFSAATGAVTATTGQTFTLSAYATCISGDITTPAMVLQVQEVSGSTFQAGTSTNIALASGAPLQRVSAVRTFNQSGVTAVRGRIGHPIVSGTTYSYTIRIASPQLDRLGVATPMIATSTGAVTRLNESTNVVGLPPDFTVSRNTTATRVNSSGLIESVASGVPRIDWLGQSCPALLVEASAQNLALQSENFGTTWSPNQLIAFGSGSVLNTTGTLDPYGTNVSDLIVASTVSGVQHRIDQTTTSASGSYTFSVFVKAAGYNFTWLRIGTVGAFFNLSNGAITGTSAGIVASSQNYGNGWYRCIISKASSSANEVLRINIIQTDGVTDFAGDGTSGIYVFGAQFELGSVATTYIPTTTGTGSRAADVISASGALVSGLIGQTEGTMYWEGAINRIDRVFFALASGSSTTQAVRLQTTGAGLLQGIAIAGTVQANPQTSGAVTLGQFYKVAFAYKENDFVLYLNGVLQATDTSGTLPTNLNSVYFCNSNGTEITDQRCRAAAIYTTRLSNAQLAELTRL